MLVYSCELSLVSLQTTEVRKLVLQPPIGARTVPCRIRTCNVATIELDGLRTSTTRSGSLFPQSKLSVATKAATLESPQATSNDIDSELLANIRKAALHLREHGWAVVEGVLPPDRCESAISAAWDWLESLGTGIKRTDPTTWDASRWPPGNFGIISTLEVAHQGFVWDVRKHPRVVKVSIGCVVIVQQNVACVPTGAQRQALQVMQGPTCKCVYY